METGVRGIQLFNSGNTAKSQNRQTLFLQYIHGQREIRPWGSHQAKDTPSAHSYSGASFPWWERSTVVNNLHFSFFGQPGLGLLFSLAYIIHIGPRAIVDLLMQLMGEKMLAGRRGAVPMKMTLLTLLLLFFFPPTHWLGPLPPVFVSGVCVHIGPASYDKFLCTTDAIALR